MVVVMLIYSETGGLKAIIYSDVLQGVLLLVVMTTPKQFDMVLRRLVALRVPKARAGKKGFWWLL